MPFVKRDTDGKIIALFNEPRADVQERLPTIHEEVQAFLLADDADQDAKVYLSRTDTEVVRILEDLVELLIEKNVIMLSELAPAAREKLLARKHLRSKFNSEAQLLIDEDDIL